MYNNQQTQAKNRKQMRLPQYDYSQSGYYFVTICIKNHKCYFGNIDLTDRHAYQSPEIKLSEIGKIAEQCWREIPKHFPNAVLDEFTIMPNHIHGIVEIVGNRHACSLQFQQCTKRQYQKLPVLIGSFKSAVTKQINQAQNNVSFAWQKSYYDHIVRNEKSLQKVREYIVNNPAQWQEDIENQKFFLSLNEKEQERKAREYYENIFKT